MKIKKNKKEKVFIGFSFFLKKFFNNNEVMICGGASVYKQYLPKANKMYLTIIECDFEGDSFSQNSIQRGGNKKKKYLTR